MFPIRWQKISFLGNSVANLFSLALLESMFLWHLIWRRCLHLFYPETYLSRSFKCLKFIQNFKIHNLLWPRVRFKDLHSTKDVSFDSRSMHQNVTLGLKKHLVLIHNKNINKIGIRANRIIPSLNLLIFIIKSKD